MSVSDHPIALRLEQRVGGATKLLATVMGLPLVDGIFPALVVAGALTTDAGGMDPWGVLQTGLLIFGGSATVAVVLAEMEGSPAQKATSVLLIGLGLIPLAVVEAAFAQTIYSMFDPDVFQRFAGLVILAIAAKTASAEVGTYLPGPGAIVALGVVASYRPSGAELSMSFELSTLLPAAAAAGTGIAFALGVALSAPQLQGAVDIDRFRFGSAVALGMLAVDVLGVLVTDQPVALAVLAVTALLSYDPNSADTDTTASTTDDVPPTYSPDADSEDRPVDLPAELAAASRPGGADPESAVGAADGGMIETEDEAPAESDEPERPPYL
ncbi:MULTISPECIES: DUF5794 domain-containing protein [Halolamina]|uniref:Uncharacterized protein n=1 Tax=Halolamina pelagica TaxID=699431 RepID=A0A1I5MGS4_9EURY|nr:MULTISPECIES: DUF5794 domain-containing protein [Halolamina]NHX36017.1 hypothetical protein [Halolamina sp. R1-12]SFP08740.1 hypothetical protein SAMN05216277_101262 [Halolamina pelagica]